MFITCPKCSAKYKIPSEIELVKGKKLQCSACQHIFEFIPNQKIDKPEKQTVLIPPKDPVLTEISLHERTIEIQKQSSGKEDSLPEVFLPLQKEKKKTLGAWFQILSCVLLLICLFLLGWYHRDLLKTDMPFSDTVQNYSVSKRNALPSFNRKYSQRNIPMKKKLAFPVKEQKLKVANPIEPKEEKKLPETTEIIPVNPSVIPLTIKAVHFRLTSQEENQAILIEGVLRNENTQTVPLPEKVFALAYGENGMILFEKEIYLPRGLLQPNAEQAFFGTYTPAPKGIQWVEVVFKK